MQSGSDVFVSECPLADVPDALSCSPASSDSTPSTDEVALLGTAVSRIATFLRDARCSAPDLLGKLQKLSVQSPLPAALRRVLRSLRLEDVPAHIDRVRREQQWAALIRAMAHVPDLHTPHVPLGEALGRTEWPETHVHALLNPENRPQLATLVLGASCHLAEHQQPADWDDVRHLLFKTGPEALRVRARITNDYFRTVHAANGTAPESN
jgi:CRISPR type I-E-associated protein CasB/Cse2